jgi:hypothetical protein
MTTNHSIKFTPAENGGIDTNQGNSVFSSLFLLGAFALTRTCDSDSTFSQYQTDIEGLDILESKSREAVSCLSDAVAALGTLLAHVDMGNINTETLQSYAWLIAAWGALRAVVT